MRAAESWLRSSEDDVVESILLDDVEAELRRRKISFDICGRGCFTELTLEETRWKVGSRMRTT